MQRNDKCPSRHFAISLRRLLCFMCVVLDRCLWTLLLNLFERKLENSLIEGSIYFVLHNGPNETLWVWETASTRYFVCVSLRVFSVRIGVWILNNLFYLRIKSKKLNANSVFSLLTKVNFWTMAHGRTQSLTELFRMENRDGFGWLKHTTSQRCWMKK